MTRKTKIIIDPEVDTSVKPEYERIATEYGAKYVPVNEFLNRLAKIYSKSKEEVIKREREV